VGLLPAAVAGLDIKAIISGAAEAVHDFASDDLAHNDCLKLPWRGGSSTPIS
jgi:glucose-6-phosphate isomerase